MFAMVGVIASIFVHGSIIFIQSGIPIMIIAAFIGVWMLATLLVRMVPMDRIDA